MGCSVGSFRRTQTFQPVAAGCEGDGRERPWPPTAVLPGRCAEGDGRRDAQAGDLVSVLSCERRALIMETASPAAALVKVLCAHDLVECAACASTKATVAADRLHVSAVAVCCEGTAAQ